MPVRLLAFLSAILLISSGTSVSAATLTYSFTGSFTQDTAGGTGESVLFPSVTTGQSFVGSLSYTTDQPHTWNVTEQNGSFTLSSFSIAFGGNTLRMSIGPFGIFLEDNVGGMDRISLSGADDTGLAYLNGKPVRAISSISLLDIDGTALGSTALVALPDLLLFEGRWLQFSLSGYFGPYTGHSYAGEIATLTQTPIPAAFPLFASALIGAGVVICRRRKHRLPSTSTS
jgi:hypothetical protein